MTDVTSVTEVTQEATEQIGQFQKILNNFGPGFIQFGLKVLLAIIVFLIGGRIIKWICKVVNRSLEHVNADVGVRQFVHSMVKYGLYALLVVAIGVKLGVEPTSVAALVASAGVAVGLALQGSISNFAGGVLILLLKPFLVGDYIIESSNNYEGTVKEIQIFYTKLLTIDNRTVVIPNGELSNHSLINVTAQDERRMDLKVGVSYDTDLKLVKELIKEVLDKEESVLSDKEILVFVSELGDNAVVIGFRAYTKFDEYWPARWRVLEAIKLSFDEHDIEIPYNQIVVHQKIENSPTF
ncbi:MAG: mechanosensitive ion channel family protein [Hespellia sp.]|nr:mechanosensitive ion channel family protein [Hespellia sp.]